MLKQQTIINGPATTSKAECKMIRTLNTGPISCTVSAKAYCCTPTPPKPEYPYGHSGYPYNPGYGKMN